MRFHPVIAVRVVKVKNRRQKVREGFTCSQLATIHSNRVHTKLFPAAAPPQGILSLRSRHLRLHHQRGTATDSATPTRPSPPATQIFRPGLRCELTNETAPGRSSRTRLPKGRCMRCTWDVPPLSPSAAPRVSPSRGTALLAGFCHRCRLGMWRSTTCA